MTYWLLSIDESQVETMSDSLKPEALAKEVPRFPSLALFEVALLVSSSPRPHSHRAQRQLVLVRCRDGCGGQGRGEGAESSVVPPPLPNPLPHPLAGEIDSFCWPFAASGWGRGD